MNPDYCYTYWHTSKPAEDRPSAIWTFHDEASARNTARMLRAQGDRARVYLRAVSVEGCTIAVWCLTIRPKRRTA